MANEKCLIDANDVYSLFDINGFARMHLSDIDTIPRVDAVEVVRCRDCKHRYNGMHCTHPQLLSCSWGSIRECKDDDFCSYGERK